MTDDFDSQDYLQVACEHCGSPLRVRIRLAGKNGTCPQCHGLILIPIPQDYYSSEAENQLAQKADETNQPGYRLKTPLEFEPDDGTSSAPPPLFPRTPPVTTGEISGVLDEAEQRRFGTRSQPMSPRFPFFTGVFFFPWYPDVWLRWIYLTVGCYAVSILPVITLSFFSNVTNYAGVAIAFFAMPQVWLTIWTGSYGVACGMQIFEDTAAGSDKVTAWPDPNWREWVWRFLYVAYVAIMAAAITLGIHQILGGNALDLQASLIVGEFFLFPVCLLSVLESNTLALLLSPAVFFTFFTRFTSWLGFFVVSGALTILVGGLLVVSWKVTPVLALAICGPLLAAYTLIYFRLLGRLAWLIASQHKRGKRKRKSEFRVTRPSSSEIPGPDGNPMA